MRITRRALLASAAAAAGSGAIPARVGADMRFPAGIWRSRRSAEVITIGTSRYRSFTVYDRAMALIEEEPLEDLEDEVLAARVTDEDSLELEYWGPVTRFRYDRVAELPAVPRYGDDRGWSSDPRLTVDAFFQVLSEHFAFAAEQGVDWPALRAGCEAALARGRRSDDSLFEALAEVLGALNDGHGWLEGVDQSAESRATESRIVRAWRMGGGRASDDDDWDGFVEEGAQHIRRQILAGDGRTAADDGFVWGRLDGGTGYLALMRCEGFSSDGGGRADVTKVEDLLERALSELGDVRGLVVDLRLNDGGWDRVGLALAGRVAERTTPAFSKHAVRSGTAVEPQAIATLPAAGRRYTGPVAVLTSDATFSAGEVTALALRALPNVRTFGWPTYGALSDEMAFRLPNGWEGTLSNEVYTAADGQVYEGRGVPPAQHAAEASPQDFWTSFDTPLRDAVAWLRSTTP